NNKFDVKSEVIKRNGVKNISVKNVPIHIFYDPNKLVAHFRPFRDFNRIRILNTVFVLITLLYIKPRNLFKKLKKKSFKQFIKEDILQTNDSKEVKAVSIALGVFIGIIRVGGFQTFL